MTARRCRAFGALLALLLTLAGCDAASPGDTTVVEPRALTAAEAEVLQADNAFTFRLFETVAAAEPGENVFLSPFSASMALGMTMNGARSTTREAMAEALQKSGLAPEEINGAYRGLLDLLPHLDRDVTVEIANSVWSREGFPVDSSFIEANRTYFDAATASLDFNDPAAADTINGWVAERTGGHIEEIVQPPIPELTMMYLVNALYFKGTWQYRFDPADTRQTPFHLTGGGTASVQMMSQMGEFAYHRAERYAALDLPYGDGLYSMTVLLPHEGEHLDTLVAHLDAEAWDALTAALHPTEVDVRLPRLRLEYEVTLNDALKALGMEVAFDPREADFGGINPDQADLHISQVRQKTFVEVNEEGTEASAATSVAVGADSAPPLFQVNRPYVFAIREQSTGAILFIGRITHPEA